MGDTVLWVAMAVLGIIFGIMTLCFERPIIMLGTSLFGSWIIISIIGFWSGVPPVMSINNLQNNPAWQAWVYLAGFVLLALIGAWVQHAHTSKGHERRKKEKEGALLG